MVQTIHAVVPGRARYKVTGLYRSQSLKKLLEGRLAKCSGIHSVSAEPLTGNVLVSFNSDNTPASVAALIEQIVSKSSVDGQGPVGTNGSNAPIHQAQPVKLHRSQLPKTSAAPATALRTKETSASQSVLRHLFASVEEQKEAPWHLMDADLVLAAFSSSKVTGVSMTLAVRNL